MNIILLICDTLRYDHIGANGNERIKTPNMDRLAERSLVFDNSYAASYATLPHRYDVLTGRYGGPFHHWMPLSHDALTLPQWLATEAGYVTQLIHDTPHLVNGGHNYDWPFHAWTQIRGAEVDRPWLGDSVPLLENWSCSEIFDYLGPLETIKAPLACYLWANRKRMCLDDWNCRKLFDTASEFLRDNARRENFFLWLDSFDPHEPWDAPPEFVKMYDEDQDYCGDIDPRAMNHFNSNVHTEEGVRRIRAWYEAKVSWLDDNIGRLLDTLEATGLDQKTAIIMTADHGTRLNEYGAFGKATPLRETEAHVPMMVCLPGGPTGRSNAIVQPQDIFATACSIAGCKSPASIESYDMLAMREDAPPRDLALSGMGLNFSDGESMLATYCDGEWCADLTVDPGYSQLRLMGQTENKAHLHQELILRLWEKTIAELLRRNMDPRLEKWIRNSGQGALPNGARMMDVAPPPPGYRQYFINLRELGQQKVQAR